MPIAKVVFKLDDKRYSVNGDALRDARERAKLSLAAFAELCGWTGSYQWRLENVVGTVSESTRNVVECVLADVKTL